jgi:hypothetical protein
MEILVMSMGEIERKRCFKMMNNLKNTKAIIDIRNYPKERCMIVLNENPKDFVYIVSPI